jgi:RNA-directed DNA polymerase
MHTDMMEKLASPENLLAAWRAVRGNIPRYRRVRSAGPDGVSLAEFERDLTTQLHTLGDMLLNERYRPVPPARFALPKKGGGARDISILTVQDRVAQRAVQQVIEPLWEPEFLDCSFGFRPGLSVGSAVECMQQFRLQGYRWTVDGDILACFDSLNHDLLMARLKRNISDGRVLDLMQAWLDAGIIQAGPPNDSAEEPANWFDQTSQFIKRSTTWALDVFAEDHGPYAAARFETLEGNLGNVPGTQDRDEIVEGMRRKALKQMLMSGLLWGASWSRPVLTRLSGAIKMGSNTPAGRRLLKRGAMTTGGLAGIAALAGATSYLLQRKAGPVPAGVLQGSPLSPLLANIYLHPFDQRMLRRRHRLVRYADDWLVLCSSRESAEVAYNDAVAYLARLDLKINRDKTHIRAPEELFQWLGISVK